MNKPSKSADRHTFQKEKYIERQTEKGEPISEAYLEFFNQIIRDSNHKFDDPATHKNNMEYDLLTTDWILEKVRGSKTYAQNLYAAMCNNDFQKREVWPILAEQTWSASWRYAGGIIADMREEGDYIDWYCSGIGDGLGNGDSDGSKGYVPEGVVTEEINTDLYNLGWLVVQNEN